MPQLPGSFELPALRPKKPGTFGSASSERPSRGSPSGIPNRTTRELRAAIIDAAALHGSDGNGSGGVTGFLFHLAANHPRSFSALIAKMLPMELSGRVDATIAAVRVMSVPAARYLTQDQIAQLQAPLIVEQDGDQIEQVEAEQRN